MEGIEDGRAVDDCYHCVFVDVGVTPCPRCENRLRYMPAELHDAGDRDALVDAFRSGDHSAPVLEGLWRLGFRSDDPALV